MQKEKVFDLKKRTFIFSLDIINFIKKLPRDYACEIICKQLLRSAMSIGANIIEAQAAPSKKDFANFYNIALKSANESKYWLMLLIHSKFCDETTGKTLLQECEEISNILAKCLITMRGK